MKKLIITVLTLGFVLVFNHQELGAVTVDELPPSAVIAEPIPLTADDYIDEIFGAKSDIAKATILHESGNSLTAINYNCRYGGKSMSCKKEDRAKAWSVDCGIGQINVRAKTCPKELLTLEGNMKAVENIYKTQGLGAWVSYTSGAYKKYM